MEILPSGAKLHNCNYCHQPTNYDSIRVEKYLVTESVVSDKRTTSYKGVKATVTVPVCQKCSTRNYRAGLIGIFAGIISGLTLMLVFCTDFGAGVIMPGIFIGALVYYVCKKLVSARVVGKIGILHDMHKFGFRDKRSCLRNITPHSQKEIAIFLSEIVEKYDYEIYNDDLDSIILDHKKVNHLHTAFAYTVSDIMDSLTLDLEPELDLDLDDSDFDFDGGDD